MGFRADGTGKGRRSRMFSSFMSDDSDAIVDRNKAELGGSRTVQNALHDDFNVNVGIKGQGSVKGMAEI